MPSERFGGRKGVGSPGSFGFLMAAVCSRSCGMLLGGAGALLMSSRCCARKKKKKAGVSSLIEMMVSQCS